MSRAWISLLIALAFVLSGCLGGGDVDPDGADGDSAGGANGTGNETAPPDDNETMPPEPNRPPGIGLEADVATGDAPLAVNFALAGSDPDEDVLAWTIDFGNGNEESGEGLPTNLSHTFNAGEFVVTLNVTDGEFTVQTNVTVTAIQQPNAEQTGTVFLCQKSYPYPGSNQIEFHEDELVDVAAGTRYEVSSDNENGNLLVVFYKEDDANTGGLMWGDGGTVPDDAAKAAVCVSATDSTAPVAISGAAFTYQDGFPEAA